MPSASATDDPPYFCTTSATGASLLPLAAAGGLSVPTGLGELLRVSCPHGPAPGRRPARGAAGSARGDLLGHVEQGVRHDGVQRPQCRAAVGAPVVEVGVLPPPQGLQRPP